ncbi:MAG: glycosyltransferase [Gammaproteobacteria bacterium]
MVTTFIRRLCGHIGQLASFRIHSSAMRPLKNLVITDGLEPPLDEAATIMAVELIESLPAGTLLLNRTCTPFPLGDDVEVIHVPTGNTPVAKFSSYVIFALMSFYLASCRRPNITHYLPLCAPGIIRQLHARLLSIVCNRFTEVLFQIPSISQVQRKLMQFDITVPSATDWDTLIASGIRNVSLIPPTPKSPRKRVYNREQLRIQYGFALHDHIISHVGHATPGRGLDFIIRLAARRPKIQWLVVVSSRARQDLGPLPRNITLLTQFVEDIYEIYYLSDGYIFPLKLGSAAVSTPLSLLEAAKANIFIICSDVPSFRQTLDRYERVTFLNMSDEATALEKAVEEIDRWLVRS